MKTYGFLDIVLDDDIELPNYHPIKDRNGKVVTEAKVFLVVEPKVKYCDSCGDDNIDEDWTLDEFDELCNMCYKEGNS